MSEAMERDPMEVADPVERARLIFTQWHVDEVTDDDEARDYADRLIVRLQEAGLEIRHGEERQQQTEA